MVRSSHEVKQGIDIPNAVGDPPETAVIFWHTLQYFFLWAGKVRFFPPRR